LVFGGVLSVQFGSALAATMIPEIGAGVGAQGRDQGLQGIESGLAR